MKTLTGLATLAVAIAGVCHSLIAYAGTVYVGTCMPGKLSFATVQEAVSSVSSGGTVAVCPGTYSGQVTIQQPLTLKALQIGENASVTVNDPGASLTTIETSIGPVGALIAVLDTGGTVDISGIVVDGTGVSIASGSVASILVDSNTGTLNHVVSQNLPSVGGNTVGILVLDDNSVSPTVTIKNSSVNVSAESATGIYVPQGNIALTVTNTYILSIPSGFGITDLSSGASTLNGNTISGAYTGIAVDGGSYTITGNTISDGYLGIRDIVSTITEMSGNALTNDSIGIQASDLNATIKANFIFSNPAETSAIDLQCTVPAALSGNTVIDAPVGLNNVPAGSSFATTAGTFFGVPVVEQICP